MDDVAFDELAFLAGSQAEGGVRDTIESRRDPEVASWSMAMASEVKSSLLQADGCQAHSDVVGGVVGRERLDRYAVGQTGVERAITAQSQALIELWQPNQDQGEQRFAVPAIVEQDVQVVEGVLVQQVGLIHEEDGKYSLAGEVFDMASDGEEDVSGGRAVGDAEGVAEMAIEVAPPEGDVMACSGTPPEWAFG